jgi:hypothetical protein
LPADDSGANNADNLTNVQAPRVVVTAATGATVLLSVDGVQVRQGMATGGSVQFTLDSLADGPHTLMAKAQNASGTSPASTPLVVTIDTQIAEPRFDLSLGSDTGTVGDHITGAGRVNLIGQTDSGATVSLSAVSTAVAAALASNAGTFQFANVPLVFGDNIFTARATDPAGNTRDFGLTIRLIVEARQDVVLRWNQATLDAIRLDASAPPVATRALAMVSTAIFDSVSAIEGTPGFLVKLVPPAGASAEAAAAAAADRVLSYLYPAQQANFDATLSASMAQVPAGASQTNGVTFGQAVGDAVLAVRANDGYDRFVDFEEPCWSRELAADAADVRPAPPAPMGDGPAIRPDLTGPVPAGRPAGARQPAVRRCPQRSQSEGRGHRFDAHSRRDGHREVLG